MSPFRDDTLSKLPNTSKVCSYPLETDRDLSDSALTSTSYFSTLEIPQKLSFEQSFKKSNAFILPKVLSPDRSLSSGECSSNSLQTFDGMFSSREPLDGTCKVESLGGPFSHQNMPGIKLPHRREDRRRSERLSSTGSGRSASSLKRQKYLEKKRKSSLSWPCGGKRSSISDDEDEGISLQPVRKVFVNEEKMAARFDGLSLSNNGMDQYHSISARSKVDNAKKLLEEIDSRLMDSDDEGEDDGKVKPTKLHGQSLQISDPLKKALKDSKTELLPDKIVKKIANPCTAMILWQPPLTDFTTDSRLREEAASSTTTGASQMDLTENETEADSQPSGVDIASASLKWTENSVSDDDMDL